MPFERRYLVCRSLTELVADGDGRLRGMREIVSAEIEPASRIGLGLAEPQPASAGTLSPASQASAIMPD